MMLITLQINNDIKARIVVQRIEPLKNDNQISTYKIVGSEKTVRHRYSDGVAKLAIKVLKALEPPKEPRKKKPRGYIDILPGQQVMFDDETP